jgi:rhodanese-related sulfurtransferase
MKNVLLFLGSILILMGCNPNSTNTTEKQTGDEPDSFIRNIDSQAFKKLMESGQGLVLDVRTPQEVTQGYIPEASVIDIYDRNFEEKIKALPKDKEIYVYCTSGVRSMQAAKILQKNGFDKVYNLGGGIVDWQRKGFSTVRPNIK